LLFLVKGDLNINFGTLLSNRKTAVNLIVIILALVISSNIYSRQSRISTVVKNKVDLETKRNDLMSQLEKTEKKILSYRDTLQEKDISLVINKISHIAHDSGLKILMIKPEKERDSGSHLLLYANLTVLAESYHKIGEFVSKLETSPELYKIDYIKIELNERGRPGEENFNLLANITITVIIFKG
jgi:Tfp pilus assembly protein PilO